MSETRAELGREIWYRRSGRVRRARGLVIEKHRQTGCVRVRPVTKKKWRSIWLSPEELRGAKIHNASESAT